MNRARVWIAIAVAAGAGLGCASGERAPAKAVAAADQTFAAAGAKPTVPAVVPGTPVPGTPVPVAPAARADSIEMTFAGDVMFGRFYDHGFRPIRAERHDPFVEVEPLLASDLALVNLETPAMKNPPKKSTYGTRMRFVAPPERVATLPRHGVTMVTIANNHFWDMHAAGVEATPTVLAELGIRAIGAGRREEPLFRVETADVKGWKVGFIAGASVCNTDWDAAFPKLPFAEPDDLADQLVPVITAARKDHDLVIVVLHWGEEYIDVPRPWQVRAAHRMIDAGADAIIGSHPHVLQGIERYKDGVIAYSLGNFLFDNTTTTKKWSGVLRLGFAKDAGAACLAGATFHPVRVVPPDNKVKVHRPTIARGKNFRAVADRLQAGSKARPLTRTTWTIAGQTLTAEGACH